MTDPAALEAPAPPGRSEASSRPGGRVALRKSAWVLGGQGAGQALRLASNLILTRLLAPDLFGLMALMNAVTRGVTMFSDVGLRGNVVHHRRGDDPLFLDSVFSLQALRGLVVWGVLAALAGPVAGFYGEPELARWVPILGVSALIAGLQSTALYTVIRRVQPERRVAVDLASQGISVVVMVAWAWRAPGLEALVAGSLSGALALCVGSHWMLPGYRNRPRLDPQAVRDILRFGRWILLSTALAFVLMQADRLLLGKVVDSATLGIYAIAAMLASMVVEVVGRIAVGVLFPIFARIAREARGELRREAARLRLGLLALGLPPLWLLGALGPELVGLLYDPRYAAAGVMAQILAVGCIASVLGVTQERLLLALGRSGQHLVAQAVGAGGMLLGLGVGGFAAGLTGALVGLSLGRWLGYGALVLQIRRHRLWDARTDLLAVAASALVIGAALALRGAAA